MNFRTDFKKKKGSPAVYESPVFWYVCKLRSGAMRILKFLDKWRFPVPFVYCDDYWMLDVGKHIFPIKKYRVLYERLLLAGAKKENFLTPQPASDEDILLVHSPRYVKRLKTGTLSAAEIALL
ncbi:MAG: hypothetical protein AB1715_12765, partial [Acidobacteriota bacterium]